jgi:hypothetical protein
MIYLSANQKMWWNAPANLADKIEIMNSLNQNPTDEAKQIASEMITQMNVGRSAPKFDVKASLYSPMNIIESSIDTTTTEGKKFTEVYDALLTSPLFKELFVDLFGGPQTRFNVKFEISDKVDKNGKEYDGFTQTAQPGSLLPTVISLNKKMFTDGTSRTRSKIEIAKTILHECIHAYLTIKGTYPDANGTPIPNIEDMSFQEVLTATRPGTGVQEDFIYNHMVPLMQDILTPLRDKLTSIKGRQAAEDLLFNAQLYSNTKNIISWKWVDYFYYLSLVGLQETAGFKAKFPNPSDSFELFLEYVT